METNEKIIRVINKYNKELPPCSKKIAHKLIKGQKATWIDYNILRLLVDDEDRKKLRKKVIEKARRKCYICDKTIPENDLITIDHVVPKLIGPDNETNWQCCCSRCNFDKGNRSLSEYIFHIKKNRAKYDILSDKKLIELECLANKIEGEIIDRLC